MDNKLRIKRVKAGIKLLESGVNPADEYRKIYPTSLYREIYQSQLGVSTRGVSLLLVNGCFDDRLILPEHGFAYRPGTRDIPAMLHNWKRFLELIENL